MCAQYFLINHHHHLQINNEYSFTRFIYKFMNDTTKGDSQLADEFIFGFG